MDLPPVSLSLTVGGGVRSWIQCGMLSLISFLLENSLLTLGLGVNLSITNPNFDYWQSSTQKGGGTNCLHYSSAEMLPLIHNFFDDAKKIVSRVEVCVIEATEHQL